MKKYLKYDYYRPNFNTPSPRVIVEKDIQVLEEKSLYNFTEEDEDFINTLDLDIKSYRYSESEKVLGKLYRAID